jgi:serine/threonine protein kinase
MIGRSLSHYRIIDKLGEGGMGVVYRAEDTVLGRQVALKLLPGDLTRDPDRVARFRREARTASSLNHPYVCTVYEVGEAEGVYYIASELVDGGSLRELLSEGGLELVRLLRFATQIAEGLSKAHEAGIVHRDVKPENILLSRDGFAKLADFGLAKLLSGADEGQTTRTSLATLPGSVLGTARYMSPEQARGFAADQRSDIFSFGLVLYEMAAGRPAYGQSTSLATIHAIIYDPLPGEPLAGCPADLVAVIRKATEKEPGERYQSAADLAVDLRRIRRGLDSGGADAPAPRRHRRWSVLAAVVLSVILVAAGWAVATLFQLRRPSANAPAMSAASAPTRMAVLPFENLSRADDDGCPGRSRTRSHSGWPRSKPSCSSPRASRTSCGT